MLQEMKKISTAFIHKRYLLQNFSSQIDFSLLINHTICMKRILLVLVIMLPLIWGCRPVDPPPPIDMPISGEFEWNFLVYMAADNNLESYGIADLKEMEVIGSTAKVNILVLFDRSPKYDTSNDDWTTTRLYRVKRDIRNSKVIISELLKDYGELDMSDPQTLSDFVDFCNTNYPAKRTFLTIWNHGTGVYPRSADTRGIGVDQTTGQSVWDMLLTDEIAEALTPAKGAGKIDILNMDACLMQMFEIGWELSGVAHVLTGSQTLTSVRGNQYTDLLRYLNSYPEAELNEVAAYVVDHFYRIYESTPWNTSYGALSLDLLESEVIPLFTQVVEEIVLLPADKKKGIKDIRKNKTSSSNPMSDATSNIPMYEYIDMVDFFTELKHSNMLESSLNSLIEELLGALDRAIISHKALGIFSSQGTNPLHGLSLNFPYDLNRFKLYSFDQGYKMLRIAKESGWYQFFEELCLFIP